MIKVGFLAEYWIRNGLLHSDIHSVSRTITKKLNREENESKITGFGAWKPVKNIGFVVIFKKFQKISRFQKIEDLKFYLAPLPDIFERKDPGFVRFTGRSDDPENLSKKY